MTETVEIDYAQYQIDTIRENMDILQANIKTLGQFVPEKDIRGAISEWRLCVTTPRKHYPKAPVLFDEMVRFDIPHMLSLILTLPPSHADLQGYINRFKDLLDFPQRYHDNYDDMFPPVDEHGQRMMSEIGYRDFLLKELQAKKSEPGELHTTDEQPYVDMESKKFKRDYKKYVEEWRAKYVKKDWREQDGD